MMIFTALGVLVFLILYASSADAVLWEEVQVDVSPTPRRFHAMAYDADNEVVVLFGGFGNGTHLNDTWVFDPKKNSWMNMEPKS